MGGVSTAFSVAFFGVCFFVAVMWAAEHQRGKIRGIERGCEMAVAAHASLLTEEDLLAQIKNHRTSFDLMKLDAVLKIMAPWDLIRIHGPEWKQAYDRYALTPEQRAIVDEFCEDCYEMAGDGRSLR